MYTGVYKFMNMTSKRDTGFQITFLRTSPQVSDSPLLAMGYSGYPSGELYEIIVLIQVEK